MTEPRSRLNLGFALIALAVSLFAFPEESFAFQVNTITDGCQVWANDNFEDLWRRSGSRMLLKAPCGQITVSYTSYVSGNTIVMNDESEHAIAVYEWDGGTKLIQVSRRLIGADRPVEKMTNDKKRRFQSPP